MTVLLAQGCMETSDNTLQQEMKLSATGVTVPGEGGIFHVKYNADSAPVARCDEDWIHSLEVSDKEKKISFSANANTTEETRKAIVSVKWEDYGLEESFTVTQAAGEKPAPFVIKEQEITETSAKFLVTPQDDGQKYAGKFISKADYELSGSDEGLFNLLISSLENAASSYGLSLEEYLGQGNVLLQGEQEISMTGLATDTEYYVFAVGISSEARQTTEIVKMPFKTKIPEKVDISFEFGYEIEGPTVKMTVTPSDPFRQYAFNVIKTATISPENIVPAYQEYIMDLIDSYGMFGITAEEVIRNITSVGTDSAVLELDADTEYYGFAVSVNNEGIINSDPGVSTFRTGAINPSNNIISISIDSVSERWLDYSINTSNDDPYVFGILESTVTAGLSDGEIIAELTSGNYDLDQMKYSGDKKGRITGLSPETGYTAFAFGYLAGTVTTSLIKMNFMTNERGIGNVTFSLLHDTWFDGNELLNLYPDAFPAVAVRNKAVLRATVQTSGESSGYYYHVFRDDLTDIMDPDSPTDDYLVNTLMNQGYTSPETYFFLEYDKPFTLTGFAIDLNGSCGPVYREKIILTEEGTTPADQFVSNGIATAAKTVLTCMPGHRETKDFAELIPGTMAEKNVIFEKKKITTKNQPEL